MCLFQISNFSFVRREDLKVRCGVLPGGLKENVGDRQAGRLATLTSPKFRRWCATLQSI